MLAKRTRPIFTTSLDGYCHLIKEVQSACLITDTMRNVIAVSILALVTWFMIPLLRKNVNESVSLTRLTSF